MAGMSAIALVGGLALSAAGTGMQFMGMQKAASAQKSQMAASMDAERQRQRAMELDAMRRTRESMRSAYVARGEALNAGANNGSQLGSGVQGQMDNISTQSNVNIAGIKGQEQIGEALHQDTMDQAAMGLKAAEGQSQAAMGAGLTSLGGAFTKSLDAFGRIGTQIGV